MTAKPEAFAYPVRQSKQVLGISVSSVYEMAKAGDITLIKIAGRTLIPKSEAERLTRVDRAA